MPRTTVVTNRCNVCKATHRPGVDDDDTEKLEDGVEDTGLPPFWSEVTVRAKQPNPDFADNERRVRRGVEMQWKVAAQQASQAKGGPLDSDDIEGLKDILEAQVRGDEEYPELVIVETEVLLCPNCTPRLTDVGLSLADLSTTAAIPPAWVPAAAPAVLPVSPVLPPVVVPAQQPAPQPVTPLSVVPAPEPPPAPRAA